MFSAETARRICCDASLVAMIHDDTAALGSNADAEVSLGEFLVEKQTGVVFVPRQFGVRVQMSSHAHHLAKMTIYRLLNGTDPRLHESVCSRGVDICPMASATQRLPRSDYSTETGPFLHRRSIH